VPLEDHKIALFIDFENIALGVKDTSYKTFDVQLVLARLLEKGKVVARRAYADWDRYGSYKRGFHEAGIELIDIPLKAYSGKNSADIRMVVDALDLCYAKEHVTTFALVSGDSDFSPLVSKLRENDKYVIGLGVKNSTSELLVSNCDEFIFYEDLIRSVQEAPPLVGLPKKQRECFALLEDAEKHHVVRLRRDQRSGTYVVTGFDTGSGEGSPSTAQPEAEPEAKPTAKARRPRRRSRKNAKPANQNA
jgi:uncharacterized protein (TIGR00288 family)